MFHDFLQSFSNAGRVGMNHATVVLLCLPLSNTATSGTRTQMLIIPPLPDCLSRKSLMLRRHTARSMGRFLPLTLECLSGRISVPQNPQKDTD